MVVDDALDTLDAAFQRAPLEFPVEQAFQARLVKILRASIDEQIIARAGYNDSDTTRYKEKYLNRLGQLHRISPVQAEVNIGSPGANRRVDVVIFEPRAGQYADLDYLPSTEEPALTVRLVDGSKYYPKAAVTHAIELKYIKNVDIAGSRLERKSLEEWPYFDRDLRKLDRLPDGVSRHLVVCTNKNPFQVGEQDARGTEKARRRWKRVQEECDARDIALREIHPKSS